MLFAAQSVIFSYFLPVNILSTKGFPHFLAIKNAISEPIEIPIKLHQNPPQRPNRTAPTNDPKNPGRTGITTCAACKRVRMSGPQNPKPLMYVWSVSLELK